MGITDFYKTIGSIIFFTLLSVLTNILQDKYWSSLIIVIGGIISIVIFWSDYIKAKEKQIIKDRFTALKNKHGTEDNGLNSPEYFGYIATEFKDKEIEFLMKNGLLNKSDYETYRNYLNIL